jgi:hypothetical protein
VVVQVARVLETGRRQRQDRGAHLLRRGLAVASRDGDHRAVERRAVALGQRAQPARGVVHCDHREVRREIRRQLALALDQQARRTRRCHLREKAVRVVVGPDDRDEELPGIDRAAVDGHARKARLGAAPQQAAAGPVGGVARAERDAHDAFRRWRARSACSQSSKGNFVRPMIW